MCRLYQCRRSSTARETSMANCARLLFFSCQSVYLVVEAACLASMGQKKSVSVLAMNCQIDGTSARFNIGSTKGVTAASNERLIVSPQLASKPASWKNGYR